jgi:hypothetical protein
MKQNEKGFPGRGDQAANWMGLADVTARPNQAEAAPARSAQSPGQLSQRDFLSRVGIGAALALSLLQLPVFGQNLKDGGAPVPVPHFSNRWLLFVWRNWELAKTDRLVRVLNTSDKSVLKLGAKLGLLAKPRLRKTNCAAFMSR